MDWWRVRRVVNRLNGATATGVLVAALGRATLRRGPRGLLLAHGYRLRLPAAAAFTVGDVVLTRHEAGWLEGRPRLLAHEERHSWQYAVWCGLPFLPGYAAAATWSWLRTGDPATHNIFEIRAVLADGGYPAASRPTVSRRRPGRSS